MSEEIKIGYRRFYRLYTAYGARWREDVGEEIGRIPSEIEMEMLDDAEKAQAEMAKLRRIMSIVTAPGTQIYPSKINADRVVVVDGRTGLDACERTAEECFNVLLREEDGGESPGRLAIVFETTTRKRTDTASDTKRGV